MKRENFLTILIAICILSYFMMVNTGMTAIAEDKQNYYKLPQEPIIKSYIHDYRDSFIREKELIRFTKKITGLEYDHCKFLVEESKEKYIDPFIVLGLIKRESDFNPNAIGAGGELGLGQLMENTAKVIAENLGYSYKHEMLLDPEFNLKLTITQLSYLKGVYHNDMHKALTAYNRGQQGLENYLKSNDERGVSDYSLKVLQYAFDYKEEFEN
ncbi:MAG: lytic transglycosylase domain-containing protein [Tissierellia bacterium]|nr:lytic transglycosylase domain-containing protein [Tissierellia bacterium]